MINGSVVFIRDGESYIAKNFVLSFLAFLGFYITFSFSIVFKTYIFNTASLHILFSKVVYKHINIQTYLLGNIEEQVFNMCLVKRKCSKDQKIKTTKTFIKHSFHFKLSPLLKTILEHA